MSVVVLGLGSGVIGALILSPHLASLLVGVSPRDPMTFVLLPVLMLFITVIASVIPTARATRVDPMTALRYE
jgi:ABC-type lipoprotein release transport system permease subunit